jgi:nucleotide-binding universal stress UspA family protein
MCNKKFIVAYDGSPSSDKALKLAGDLIKAEPIEISLVLVIERPSDLFNFEQM